MYTKTNNLTADGTRQIVVDPMTGAPLEAFLLFRDGNLRTYQQGDGVVYTAKNYPGVNQAVLGFLNKSDEDDGGMLITDSNRVKVSMALDIVQMVNTDCFGYMTPMTTALANYLHELTNELIVYAAATYSHDNDQDMSYLEYTLQPFWDGEMAVGGDFNENMFDTEQKFFHYHQYCLIYQTNQGVWVLIRLNLYDLNKGVVDGTIIPSDAVGDVMFIHTERRVTAKHIDVFEVLRLKGNTP